MTTKTADEKTPANGKKETKTRSESGTREKITRTVRIGGVTDIMFDRYPGDNDTKLEPWQKLYLGGESGRTICLPTGNIMSFLSAKNTDSAPKRLLDSRVYKKFTEACCSFVNVNTAENRPGLLPFTRQGEAVEFGKIDGKTPDGWLNDSVSGVYIKHDVARLEKGIPNPKVRPVLPLPWELTFYLTIYPNRQIQEQQLLNIFSEGLLAVGLGTYRGQYGKAEVLHWE